MIAKNTDEVRKISVGSIPISFLEGLRPGAFDVGPERSVPEAAGARSRTAEFDQVTAQLELKPFVNPLQVERDVLGGAAEHRVRDP